MIYLDYNATSPLRPGVKAAMDALGTAPLNPASVHSAGRLAKKLLEESRASIASALGAFPNEVLLVGSGSEANNMVLRAFAPSHALLVSSVEHASVAKTASLLGGAVVPVDSAGVLRLEVLERMLVALGRPALVSVMLANNETGVIQPIAEIARIVHTQGGLLHCDAVQAFGKIPVDWGLLGVDMLTLCAHKSGGPVGAGALLIRNDLPIKPLIVGGKQELSRRAGTENIPAIVGFAQMVREVTDCAQAPQWLAWREWLAAEILAVAPGAMVMGLPRSVILSNAKDLQPLGDSSVSPQNDKVFPPRLPNTLMVTMPGVKSETQLMRFDLEGFALSAGSACSSGRMEASGTLLAMGVAPEIASTAIRISWGWATTQAEIEAFAQAWKDFYQNMQKSSAA